jgi:hypothetical protein
MVVQDKALLEQHSNNNLFFQRLLIVLMMLVSSSNREEQVKHLLSTIVLQGLTLSLLQVFTIKSTRLVGKLKLSKLL